MRPSSARWLAILLAAVRAYGSTGQACQNEIHPNWLIKDVKIGIGDVIIVAGRGNRYWTLVAGLADGIGQSAVEAS